MPCYAPGVSESKGSSSAANANAGFSPAPLVAIDDIVEKVLNKTLIDCVGPGVQQLGVAWKRVVLWMRECDRTTLQ